MPTKWTPARYAVLVVTGMIVLLAGVVAGSAVGSVLSPDPEFDGSRLLLGEVNRARSRSTRVVGNAHREVFRVTQRGDGPGIRGESASGPGGAFETQSADSAGVLVTNLADDSGHGAALRAEGGANTGVRATSAEGLGVWASGDEVGVYSEGIGVVHGDLLVSGTCTGCVLGTLALNDSGVALRQGEAVMVTGLSADEDGVSVLTVAPAGIGDAAIGIVDTAMVRRSERVDSNQTATYYVTAGASVAPGDTMRVITAGIAHLALADAAGGEIQAGDNLVAGATRGVLTRRSDTTNAGISIGYALGTVQNGYVAVFVAPH